MAKVISQETYDEVIKENVTEFSMSVDEARVETIQQFEAQGINLANIIKDLTINEETGEPVMKEAINALKAHVEKSKELDAVELEKQLSILASELSKSIAHRVQASKNNTLDFLLEIMKMELQQSDHLKDSVSSLTWKIDFFI
jgi:armadillo repeat-containing protein 6